MGKRIAKPRRGETVPRARCSVHCWRRNPCYAFRESSRSPAACCRSINAPSMFEVSTASRATRSNASREDLGECTRCKLHTTRNKIVFGAGNPRAELVFVGEGPGHDEDVQGLPFVGRAGKLLTQMIEAMGLRATTSTSQRGEVPPAGKSQARGR